MFPAEANIITYGRAAISTFVRNKCNASIAVYSKLAAATFNIFTTEIIYY